METIVVEPKPFTYKQAFMIVLGSSMYACAVNWFMMPLSLYAGGIVGLAQLIRTLFLSGVTQFDVAGIINFLLNVPLFMLAYKSMSKRMFYCTILSLIVQTIVFTIVKVPASPIVGDKLASIIIAGLIGGVGCGIILTNGGSAGGLDLLGVYLTQIRKKFSVGAMNLGFNLALYTVCAILFKIETAIYSILFVAAFSLAIDKFHYQNIELELMIFTHHKEVADMVMSKYVRGVTEWDGKGAYTGNATHVFVTVVAKSEVESVKRDILSVDPKAFIIEHSGTRVTGGYQKRLV